jgi:hypothetical protein
MQIFPAQQHQGDVRRMGHQIRPRTRLFEVEPVRRVIGLYIQPFQRSGQTEPRVQQIAGVTVRDTQSKLLHRGLQAGRALSYQLDLRRHR